MTDDQLQLMAASGLWLVFFLAAGAFADGQKGRRWTSETVGALLVGFAFFFNLLIRLLFRTNAEASPIFSDFLRFIGQFTLTVVGTKLLCSRAQHTFTNVQLTTIGLSLVGGALFLVLGVKPNAKGVFESELLAQFVYVLAGMGATILAERLGHPRDQTLRGNADRFLLDGGSSSPVFVHYGDVLGQPGLVAFAVSDFFEHQIGRPVAVGTVQGQFLRRFFSGNPGEFSSRVRANLAARGIVPEIVDSKLEGNRERYPLGTTARIDIGNQYFLPIALTRADPKTLLVGTTLPEYIAGLSQLWRRVREEGNDEPVSVPVMGAGLARTGLPVRQLVTLIAASFAAETAQQRVCRELRIFIGSREDFELIRKVELTSA